MSLDWGRAIVYAFEDRDWKSKIGIGALIMLVPVLSFAGVGYELEIMRNVARGEPYPLPDWSDIGRLFRAGWRLGLAYLIYSLPILVWLLFALFSFVFLAIGGPLVFAGDRSDAARLAGLLIVIMIIAGFLGVGVIILWGWLVSLIRPAVAINYLRRGTFWSCFDFGAILALVRANIGDYLLAWLMIIVTNMALWSIVGMLSGLLSWVPCIGQLFYWAVLGGAIMGGCLVMAHLEGQLMSRGEIPAKTGGEPGVL